MEVEEAYLARLPKYNSNSQFAIVEYENHKAAAVARRVLIPDYGTIFAIDWAVPPKERKRNITVSKKFKIKFLINFLFNMFLKFKKKSENKNLCFPFSFSKKKKILI